jgi:hypothetical protein
MTRTAGICAALAMAACSSGGVSKPTTTSRGGFGGLGGAGDAGGGAAGATTSAGGTSGSAGANAAGGSSGSAGATGAGGAGGAAGAGGPGGAAGATSTGGSSGSAGAGGRSGSGGAGGAADAGGPGGAAGATSTGGSSGSAGAGGQSGSGGAGGTAPTTDAPSSALTFTASDAVIMNPERGFYATANLATGRNFSNVRQSQKTLLYGRVHLDAYLGTNHAQDLPPKVLEDVDAGFAAARTAGIKVIVRFYYDNGEGYASGTGANDAPKDWMIKHIQQLAPVLRRNEDVLFVYQAGFIGAWAEWHSSQNFRDGMADAAIRKEVVEAMLAGSPESRTVGLRYPAYKRMFYGTAPISAAQAFTATSLARVGHFNDCFVSGTDDVGTYQYEPMATLKDYLALDTRYAPMGGETCAAHARNECPIATGEMERFHWTYINEEYNQTVISRWTAGGCRADIDKKLGYRIVLTSGSAPKEVKPGGSFTLKLGISNVGWAAMMTPRPVILVLESAAGQRLEAVLPADPRMWLPGAHEITVRLRVPANLVPGTYRLALWLPDMAQGLRSRAEYSVQIANQGVWNATRGDSTLAQITLADSAPGTADPGATSFAVIP